MIWQPMLISLKVTAIAAVVLFPIAIALAYLLARVDFPGRNALESIITLPLVLPPTVVGYYLLLGLGRGSPIHDLLGIQIVFTWQAAVVASVVVGLPLMVEATRAAFDGVDRTLENAARTLGASEWKVFWRITLPLARAGVIAGIILSTARALGEFGATLMVAGNIPGRTQTMPLAIYDAVQNRDAASANLLVILMTALALLSVYGARLALRRRSPRASVHA